MDKKFPLLLLFLTLCLCVSAAPAKPGLLTMKQPDGRSFTAILKGDEFGHLLMTADGCGIIQDKDGYYSYAYFDSFGNRYSSGVHVGDSAPSDALVGSRQIPFNAINSIASQKRLVERAGEQSALKRMREGRAKTLADGDETTVKHGLVILAQFSDLSFTYTRADFEALLNQEGYSENGATGSAVEYFNAQFNGLIDFQFTVSDIVTLSNPQAYYGGNDSYGNDLHPEEMVSEACRLADDSIDFSLFDDDGDGYVDNVFVFFAGGDEAQGAGDDCIWSHAWYIYSGAGITLVLDGVGIDRYACSSELYLSNRDYTMTGIGTFCHEYSHTFGLPDFYDTDYDTPEGSDVAAGFWMSTSLMDGGNYNNNGNTPPYFNAVERDWLGIFESETIEPGEYSLEPIHLNGRYLRMETGVEGEFYLFECRSTDGWDKYINHGNSAGGLLVYHIDQSKTRTIYSPTYNISTSPYLRWVTYNEVNANPEHQCADLVEADGRTDQTTSSAISNANVRGVFFPEGNTEFTPETNPSFRTWDGYSSELSITEISMSTDTVFFTALSSADVATPFAVDINAVTFQDAAIISWNSDYSTTRKAHISLESEGIDDVEINPYSIGNYAYTAENLNPGTTYTVKIWYNDYDYNPGETKTYSFTTKSLSSNGFAYIYFTTPAKSDGSFSTEVKIPLRVYNAVGAASVVWTYGSAEISVGDDGYYHPTGAGTLKATVTYEDGTKEIIQRKITLTEDEEEEEE